MKPTEASRNHSRVDLVLIHELWTAGISTSEIAKRFGVSMSTVTKWAQRYKLPRRTEHPAGEPDPPSPEDEVASLAGLALSPWVEERARQVREKHFAERMGETEANARSKANSWRRGEYQPSGARHVQA